jgi:DNA-binding beta-propeller fold protein YncE
VNEHESSLRVTEAPSSSLSRGQVLKGAVASAVGAIALAMPASGLSAPAPQRIRPPVTPPGTLTQLPGSLGCLVDRATPRRGCQPVRALRGPGPLLGFDAVALSPNGKNLYVASARSNAIAVFRRNQATGQLAQAPGPTGCVADSGAGGCGLAVGLVAPNSVAVSPDGDNVYATSAKSRSVTIFWRNRTTGALTRLPGAAGCVAKAAAPGCTSATALNGPDVVVVSPDGKDVYVGAFFGSAVLSFTRDGATGALTQLQGSSGCIAASNAGCASGLALNQPEGLAISGDGTNVYVAAALSAAVDVLTRNPATGALTQATDGTGCLTSTPLSGCGTGRALRGADAVTVSADDRNVYVTAGLSQSIAMFNRASGSGTLTQPAGASGCVMRVVAFGCGPGRKLIDPEGLVGSPDGANLYATVFGSGALGVFDRQPSTGALMQKPGQLGCFVSKAKRDCTLGRGGVHGVSSAVISPDGKYLYAVANASNSITVFRIAR